MRLYSWFERMMRSMYIHAYVIYVRVFLYACKKNSVRGVESLENTVTRFGIKKVRAIFAFKWDPNLRNFPPCTSTRKAKKRDGLRKNSRSGMLNSAAVRYTGCSQFQFHRFDSTLARFCSVLFFFFWENLDKETKKFSVSKLLYANKQINKRKNESIFASSLLVYRYAKAWHLNREHPVHIRRFKHRSHHCEFFLNRNALLYYVSRFYDYGLFETPVIISLFRENDSFFGDLQNSKLIYFRSEPFDIPHR